MSDLLGKVSLPEAMHGRAGFPLRNVIYFAVVLTLLYVLYIYHASINNLRESEMVGARYKREAEERVAEIQDLVREKDRERESSQTDKIELNKRIKSLNQQYSMLQSQYKETEADFIKLRQDMETLKTEHSQAVTAHAAEYEKLKQEKDTDIAKLKDDIADLTKRNSNAETLILNLRQKVKEAENSNKHLQEENIQLQLLLQNRPKSPALGQQKPESGVPQQPHISDARDQVKRGPDLSSFRSDDALANLVHIQTTAKPDAKLDDLDGGKKSLLDDNFNARHQVQPPSNNNDDFDGDNGKKEKDGPTNIRLNLNPNDGQRVQIIEPNLDLNERHQDERHQGGGEAGVVKMNARGEEEARERYVREEEAEILHKDPLALGQIQMPGEHLDLKRVAGHGNKAVEQQAPPLLGAENEQKDQDHEDNHYFVGEDDDAQRQQQQHDDERHRMEEERDDGDEGDFDDNADRFRNALGNQENKEAALADADTN